MLSNQVRDQGLKLSKWPQFQYESALMRRAADELDKRAATIRRLQNIIDAKSGATCAEQEPTDGMD